MLLQLSSLYNKDMDKTLLESFIKRQLSAPQIATEMGCSLHSINHHLKKHGLSTDYSSSPWLEHGTTLKAMSVTNTRPVIAETFHVPLSTINFWFKKLAIKTRAAKKPFCAFCGKPLEGHRRANKCCNNTCFYALKRATRIAAWKAGKISGVVQHGGTSSFIREYLFEKYDSQCCQCGWHKVNPTSGKIPLELNHIDGNWKNNIESNLELLCPNCHALTPTHKALNMGKGRNNR